MSAPFAIAPPPARTGAGKPGYGSCNPPRRGKYWPKAGNHPDRARAPSGRQARMGTPGDEGAGVRDEGAKAGGEKEQEETP